MVHMKTCLYFNMKPVSKASSSVALPFSSGDLRGLEQKDLILIYEMHWLGSHSLGREAVCLSINL